MVSELKKRMLGVGARFSENDGPAGLIQEYAFGIDRFAVAFHVELLNMGCKLGQRGGIGDNGLGRIF